MSDDQCLRGFQKEKTIKSDFTILTSAFHLLLEKELSKKVFDIQVIGWHRET